MEPRRRRLLLIEDHDLFAEALTLALDAEGYAVRRIAPADTDVSLGPLLAAAVRARADLVVLGLELGHHEGDALIRPLSRAGSRVVVVTSSVDRARWGGCLQKGAKAVVPRYRPLAELVELVGRVEARLPAVPDEELRELTALWQQRRTEDDDIRLRLSRLSPREKLVLGELMAGHTAHDISQRVDLDEETVRTVVASILDRLGVSTQIAAVGAAHRVSWRPSGTLGIE